jgi:hypothetical protein
MDKPPCRASALWEGIRSDDLFDIGSGGTGGRELEGGEVVCGKARRALAILELVGRRAWIPLSGLFKACSTDTFTGANTSSCSSLWVLLTLFKKGMGPKPTASPSDPCVELGIRSLTSVGGFGITGGKISNRG